MKQALKSALKRTGLRRQTVASARMCCERNLLAAFGRRYPHPGGRILCYHSVGQPAWGVNDVPPKLFRRHLELAVRLGYRFVPAAQIAAGNATPRDLAITFDDGLSSVLTNAAPILADFGAPSTLFVVSDWASGKPAWDADTMLTWSQIERLAGMGVEIGSHSVTHPNFAWISQEQAVDELGRSRQEIERHLGIAPATFAIPLGQSMNWPAAAAKAAREVGYTTVYAQAEQTHPSGTVPRTFVTAWDNDRVFKALLRGAYDRWEEWV